MAALFAVALPVGGDTTAWTEWGLAGLVIGYVLWRDWEREKRMSAALEAHNQWVQQTLVAALERCSVAMEGCKSRQQCEAGDGKDGGR